ncbi:MAG: hypothetical protein NW202_13045 [Nitrospira sp.]|nr:hypothetical protein [Nitrospira sp.]
MKHTSKQFAVVKAADGVRPSITISTGGVDRDGDRLLPEGCDKTNYKKNPVVLYGHDYHSLPVGGDAQIVIVPGKDIRASWRWLEGDEFAARVKNAFEQRFLSASVGFKPKEAQPNEFGGHDITKWELLEFSLVPVPANPECTRALKSLGLLDDGGEFIFEDEDQYVLQSPATILRLTREATRACLREAIPAAIRREIAYQRGRIID